jgi:predicted transcriptional regulator
MSDKQAVLDAVSQMPDTVSLDQIHDEVALLKSLREGLSDSEAGRVISHEEVKKRFASWPSN